MAEAELMQMLERTASPGAPSSSPYHDRLADPAHQTAAQNYFEAAAKADFVSSPPRRPIDGVQAQFILLLSAALRSEQINDFARSAAGLQLKNRLVARDSAVQRENQLRWMAVPKDKRELIKENVRVVDRGRMCRRSSARSARRRRVRRSPRSA